MTENNNNGRRPYVNPVKCLNFEGGHDYQYELSVKISSSKVDPISGEMIGKVEKEYNLEAICRHCMDRIHLHTKKVGLEENVTLAQMLEDHRAKLAEAYYAEHPEKRPAGR